jgi:hypothetical protein
LDRLVNSSPTWVNHVTPKIFKGSDVVFGCELATLEETICHELNLKIRGVDFIVNLIVLDSKGIDVILRMGWLSNH